MKTSAALEVKEDGQIWLIPDCPQEPTIIEIVGLPRGPSRFKQRLAYETAIASADRLLVSNQEVAKELIWQYGDQHNKPIVKPGLIVPVPGLKWEVKSNCELWCADCKAFDWSTCKERLVAVISKSESPLIGERSAEEIRELWIEAERLMVKLLPPADFGESYDAEVLYHTLEDLRDAALEAKEEATEWIKDIEKAMEREKNYAGGRHPSQQYLSRIAELEADNKVWEALENDRAEEIGKLMAKVSVLEKELQAYREYCERNGLGGL